MTLAEIEKKATKRGNPVVVVILNNQEFEVQRIVKSRTRRFSYRHGKRHMGRDEAELLFATDLPKDLGGSLAESADD